METGNRQIGWGGIIRIIAKAALIVILLNITYAILKPQETIGAVTLYNHLFPGRLRLPYGENSQESYSVSLSNIPALFASHIISEPKAEDEFRIFIIGDSGTWGWLLENRDTLATQINELGLVTGDDRRIVTYNLGYPIMSLTKDLMILDAALAHDPDLIIWPVTLESFPRDKQLFAPIVQNNPQRIRSLIERYNLNLDAHDSRLVDPTLLQSTLIGQRRNLADLLRHQFYGFSWAATGIDQAIPGEIKLRRSDFEQDLSWQDFQEPVIFSDEDLAFDALAAGAAMVGDVRLLIVNEPMYISDGLNSDLRYNSFYPRWAYDQYREMLQKEAESHNWAYLDLWDRIEADEFSDTPVHLTAQGTKELAAVLRETIEKMIEG